LTHNLTHELAHLSDKLCYFHKTLADKRIKRPAVAKTRTGQLENQSVPPAGAQVLLFWDDTK